MRSQENQGKVERWRLASRQVVRSGCVRCLAGAWPVPVPLLVNTWDTHLARSQVVRGPRFLAQTV